jgi:hypothetical protein
MQVVTVLRLTERNCEVYQTLRSTSQITALYVSTKRRYKQCVLQDSREIEMHVAKRIDTRGSPWRIETGDPHLRAEKDVSVLLWTVLSLIVAQE